MLSQKKSKEIIKDIAAIEDLKTVFYSRFHGNLTYCTKDVDITMNPILNDRVDLHEINIETREIFDIFMKKGMVPVTNAVNYDDSDRIADLIDIFSIKVMKDEKDKCGNIYIEPISKSRLSFFGKFNKIMRFLLTIEKNDPELFDRVRLYGELNIEGFPELFERYQKWSENYKN